MNTVSNVSEAREAFIRAYIHGDGRLDGEGGALSDLDDLDDFYDSRERIPGIQAYGRNGDELDAFFRYFRALNISATANAERTNAFLSERGYRPVSTRKTNDRSLVPFSKREARVELFPKAFQNPTRFRTPGAVFTQDGNDILEIDFFTKTITTWRR